MIWALAAICAAGIAFVIREIVKQEMIDERELVLFEAKQRIKAQTAEILKNEKKKQREIAKKIDEATTAGELNDIYNSLL
jgi:hypothetical protein